jgi:hypothetical protein
MCQHGEVEKVKIDGREIFVDKCLAPIIQALNDGGIITSISCCGHGDGDGAIMTYYKEQYRLLIVCPEGKESLDRYERDFRKEHERFDNIRQREEIEK